LLRFFAEKPSAYTQSAEIISKASNSINVQADIKAFVNENKTGAHVPSDIPYITFDSDQPAVPKPNKAKPKVPGAKIGSYNPTSQDILSDKNWGLSPADSSLPNDEKQRKLSGQMEELDKAIASESKARDGLKNLVTFYATDPVSQKRAEDQVQESEEKLARFRETKTSVQRQIDSLSGGGGGGGAPPRPQKSSGHVKARGLYDYTATCDTELTFKTGDILTVTEQDDSGWWYAELNGQSGFVPNNYVEPI